MYERNINVLEMFVEKKLGYVETNNIKNNYFDYQEFVKVLDDYINICEAETKAKTEYDLAVTDIQNIQKNKEKLYNQNVKFEYSRNLLFADVNRKVEDIEKCLVKIENALDKNKDTFKNLRKNFIQGIITLNEKHRALKQISRPKNKIETEYHDALELLTENYHSINPDDIELARKFTEDSVSFEEELVEKMMKNGKDEKVPFDLDAITCAAKLGLDIAKKEAENYLFMYEQTGKILNELENDKLKIEARKKHITDVGVKLSFLNAEKDYLVQFLDNERVTAIQGQAEHDRLMKNCCKILQEDVNQINILYDLIIKETKKRATNRCYEELYNKSYLEDIQAKEKKFIEKTTNLDYANGTIISPNYWRIDSIKAIYENFDKNVYETYGRKFVAPEEQEEVKPQVVERVVERVVEKVVEKPVEKIIERIIEKPVEIVPENPEFKELDRVLPDSESAQNVQKIKTENAEKIIPKRTKAVKAQNTENKKSEKAKIIEPKEEQKEPVLVQKTKTASAKKTEQQKAKQAKPFHKFKRIKRTNQILEEDDNYNIQENFDDEDIEVAPTNHSEDSIFAETQAKLAKSNQEFMDDELEDLEAIIKETQANLAHSSKANLIKKIVKSNKGKLAKE